MKLWGYFRSSAAYRVRIALNLKGLAYQHAFVHLARGEQGGNDYAAANPQKLVPMLAVDMAGREQTLTQSMAILEYLEEVYPSPALLPSDPLERGQARALANIVTCDIHPLNNLRVLNYLRDPLGQGDEAVNGWYRHWVKLGFDAIEPMIQGTGFCFGDAPTFADICLIPQVFNARRFKVDLAPYPRLRAVDEHCNSLKAFVDARPENQPDAE